MNISICPQVINYRKMHALSFRISSCQLTSKPKGIVKTSDFFLSLCWKPQRKWHLKYNFSFSHSLIVFLLGQAKEFCGMDRIQGSILIQTWFVPLYYKTVSPLMKARPSVKFKFQMLGWGALLKSTW